MSAASPGNQWQAVAACIAVTVAFVAPLHFFGGPLPRNHPRTIRRRMCCVLVTCSLAWLPTAAILRRQGQSSSDLLLVLLGLGSQSGASSILALALPVAHVLLGFLGPLIMCIMDKPPAVVRLPFFSAVAQRHSHDPHVSHDQAADIQQHSHRVVWRPSQGSLTPEIPWAAVRNYVFAPFAEEWCFRACMIPMLLAQGWSSSAAVWLSTCLFGAAHLHLLLEMLLHEGMDIKAAIIAVLFQFAYTSCFGAYAACLLLQSGTVLAPIGAHIACNVMGVPDFSHMAQHPKSSFLLVMTAIGVVCFWWTFGAFVDSHCFCHNSPAPCLNRAIQGLSQDNLARQASWHN